MQIVVKADTASFERSVDSTEKQVRFAEMLALNWTAKDAREAVRAEMRSVFDRPTPFSLNAFQIEVATRARLVARIEQRYAAGGSKPRHWFEPNVYGGPRRPKAFEKALAAKLGMPVGSTYFLPGKAARLDAYGNLSSGQLGQILSDLGARQIDPRQNATDRSRRRNKRSRHFVIKNRATGAATIVVRKGSDVGVVLTAVQAAPDYGARFDFFGVIAATARRRFPIRLDEAMRRAMATAR